MMMSLGWLSNLSKLECAGVRTGRSCLRWVRVSVSYRFRLHVIVVRSTNVHLPHSTPSTHHHNTTVAIFITHEAAMTTLTTDGLFSITDRSSGLRIAQAVGLSTAFYYGLSAAATFTTTPAILLSPAPLLAKQWKTMRDSDKLSPIGIPLSTGVFAWLALRGIYSLHHIDLTSGNYWIVERHMLIYMVTHRTQKLHPLHPLHCLRLPTRTHCPLQPLHDETHRAEAHAESPRTRQRRPTQPRHPGRHEGVGAPARGPLGHAEPWSDDLDRTGSQPGHLGRSQATGDRAGGGGADVLG